VVCGQHCHVRLRVDGLDRAQAEEHPRGGSLVAWLHDDADVAAIELALPPPRVVASHNHDDVLASRQQLSPRDSVAEQ
jgi:hypothetical protein